MIYNVFPVRIYPELMSQIIEADLFIYEYHDPFESKTVDVGVYTGILPKRADIDLYTYERTRDNNGIGVGLNRIDFMYGVFPHWKLLGDRRYRFTVLQHPVDHMYSMYDYFQFCLDSPCSSYTQAVINDMEQYKGMPMEHFIDIMLETDGVVYGKNTNFISEVTRIKDLSPYDAIYTVEDINKAVSGISDIMGIPLRVTDRMHHKADERDYRRKDLEDMMSTDLALWESVC